MTGTWSRWRRTVAVTPDQVSVTTRSGSRSFPVSADPLDVELVRGVLTYRLQVSGGERFRLWGLKKKEATDLRSSLATVHLRKWVSAAIEWRERVDDVVGAARVTPRWISREQRDDLETARPIRGLFQAMMAQGLGDLFSPVERSAACSLEEDLTALVDQTNDDILGIAEDIDREFFAQVERRELTSEQRNAVVTFDNRVRVVAAAGSGKTSVMVARAAYAVEKGFVRADRVLMMAFNKAAASELKERVVERFTSRGLHPDPVTVSTFHALGLDTIGQLTGKKPRVAPWVENGQDLRAIADIVSELRESDATFSTKWDLFRLVFAPVATGAGPVSTGDLMTFAGHNVRSEGERMIANFLFVHGVHYEYEAIYPHVSAMATRSDYRPDFYYPDVDIWHEHWATGPDGRLPKGPGWGDYGAQMEWKRRVHREFETELLETTWGDVVIVGDGLDRLRARLEQAGVEFHLDPSRAPKDLVVPEQHLHSLIRAMISHAKSNRVSAETVEARLTSDLVRLDERRTRAFLEIFWPVLNQWNSRLQDSGQVDFDDMLLQAADLIKERGVDLGYDLVLVDELQDVSQARTQLINAIINHPHRYFMGVGDDWQAINRFAGADINVMTDFEAQFGYGPTTALSTTFRCTQQIADVAASFISKNPRQLGKTVSAQHSGVKPLQIQFRPVAMERTAIDVWIAAQNELLRELVKEFLREMPEDAASVLILARYNRTLNELSLDDLRSCLPNPDTELRLMTIHGSKGLEADHVLILNLTRGAFPSLIGDDAVLDLVMPVSENFPLAEERRLFYVALTRARHSVTMLVDATNPSPFAVEIKNDCDTEGEIIEPCAAPGCFGGILIEREGRYGKFYGCSNYPLCKNSVTYVDRAWHCPQCGECLGHIKDLQNTAQDFPEWFRASRKVLVGLSDTHFGYDPMGRELYCPCGTIALCHPRLNAPSTDASN